MKKEQNSEEVVTRFAPSPTGVLHLGGARTALFNYLFARKNDGKFILRIEDTDKGRSKKEYEEDIIKDIEWLGIKYDEFYRQSERTEIYKKYIDKLLETGKAYVSDETSRNDLEATLPSEPNTLGSVASKLKSASVIRFKNPGSKISFDDTIRGKIEFDVSELGDFVIAKDTETPLFHLTNVIDDFEMSITHIIRGEDHISNTPRQMLIRNAIAGCSPERSQQKFPMYAHLPLILGPDKSKLSKRHGAASVTEYKERGYLPEALVNFLAFLGWNPGDERELFSTKELVNEFSLERIKKSAAIFNVEKLDWFNREYIKKSTPEQIAEWVEKYSSKQIKGERDNLKTWRAVIALLIDDKRISKAPDIEKLWQAGDLDYFFTAPTIRAEALAWSNKNGQKDDSSLAKKHLRKVVELLKKLPENEFVSHNIKETIWAYAEKEGRGSVLWPWRMVLSGRDKSPDPFILSEILGKKEALRRLENAAV